MSHGTVCIDRDVVEGQTLGGLVGIYCLEDAANARLDESERRPGGQSTNCQWCQLRRVATWGDFSPPII